MLGAAGVILFSQNISWSPHSEETLLSVQAMAAAVLAVVTVALRFSGFRLYTLDALTASKAVADWRKKNGKDLRFKAGLFEGKLLGPDAAEKLTKMPSAQEVRQMAVSVIAGPLTATVNVLANTLSALPSVIRAIADKEKEGE